MTGLRHMRLATTVIALALAAACGTDAPPKPKPAPPPAEEPAEPSPEEQAARALGELAAAIAADPAAMDALLKEAGMTRKAFADKVMDLAGDPALTAAYEAGRGA